MNYFFSRIRRLMDGRVIDEPKDEIEISVIHTKIGTNPSFFVHVSFRNRPNAFQSPDNCDDVKENFPLQRVQCRGAPRSLPKLIWRESVH